MYEVNKSELTEAVSILQPIFKKPGTIMATAMVLVKKEGNDCWLTANNTASEGAVKISASGEDGISAVPGEKLAALAKKATTDNISVNIEDGKTIFKSGRSRISLGSIKVEDFPVLSNKQANLVSGSVPAKGTLMVAPLVSALKRIAVSSAKADHRKSLNGVHIETHDGIMEIVASDGHRLSRQQLDVGDIPAINTTIPIGNVDGIIKMLSANDAPTVDIEVTQGLFSFIFPDARFSSALIADEYPNWRQIIESVKTGENDTATVEKDELMSAIETVSIATMGQSSSLVESEILINLEQGSMKLSSRDATNDMAVDTIDCKYEGESLEAKLTPRYLTDAVKTMSSAFEISVSTSKSMLVVTDKPNKIIGVIGLRV